MKAISRVTALLCAGSLLFSAGAWADTPPSAAASQTQLTAPAPDSPQAIQDLHKLLREAYRKGEQAAQGMPNGIPAAEPPELPNPALQQPGVVAVSHRPILAAWVEVLRDAITTLSSAFFIAAWGFAIGMLLFGMAAILYALRATSRKDRLRKEPDA